MKIGIACGGTGGHIFPGLAVAEALRRRGHTVVLWLAGKPGEDLALVGWVGTVVTVYARGVSSYAPRAMIATCFRLVRAVLQCRQSMQRFSPDVLLAMGSYASIGPVLAARWLNIPVVLHEANVIPGRAIRFLSRWAEAVAVGFEETRHHLAHRRLVVTGMPVRETGRQAAEEEANIERRIKMKDRCRTTDAGPQSEIGNRQSKIENWGALAPTVFTLLIMGGSRGAHRLNAIVSQAILRLHREGNSLQVIHLAGPADEESIRQVYRQTGLPATAGVPHAVFGFLHDMPWAYQMASLAICRSGASTCAELSYYGVPALLVPYPFAIHQHQAANADALASAGAADICDEQILTVDWLAGYVTDLMRDTARLANMRTAALQRVTNNPASTLAELVEEVGGGIPD
ncbi:MAG: undecaprenyldiphospho-muramoylpentapeptide beta-N-acetylglucosaminyltransferase [Verrucomicrobia bacterium]|nr:undecaprenyldiphospho-muramoylpentapeptide beta-N-acetylglucosaminyltransferase [Verrucomicrobiota bacterium]MBU1735997.1 undecaprenyldiphospho-muramoylpentapeptide beta-N-acetylglucosaminyltransferase [Verrucomicrobiota bacterium]MBU1856287.1 undecaprenyldiphospho-muramoylpentapeptide beta-N-acetylglucosaminyltransferase [Verrucomicrobiota bacterium]